MARPQRNNVDYFPFLCEDGNKMFYLEETYGNDGFAVFIKLLRELARTDFHYLDLSKPSTMMFLSAKCKVSKEVLDSIIKDLVELEKFDAELWNENSIIWCQDFIDSIQDAYIKRTNNCIDRNSLLTLLVAKGVRKQSKSTPKPLKSTIIVPLNPQRIEEYSKLNKKKVEYLELWVNYRKEIKKEIKSDATLKTLINKLHSKEEKVIESVINNSIENGWTGLFWDKYISDKPKVKYVI